MLPVGANSSGIDNNPASQAGPRIGGVKINSALQIPTVFDAIRTAGGVTPFSNLSDVIVTRKLPLSKGGGKIRTSLNFLTLITEGNESQNIRLFDNDTVVVARSPVELREQIIKAGQTNLSPDFLKVFVTGRVRDPGTKILPQGASLTRPCFRWRSEADAWTGRVHTFQSRRTTDRRKFFVVVLIPPAPQNQF